VTVRVDGNAIAGDLFVAFGREMTAVGGRCRHCGSESAIAQLHVYARGPGAVARCPTCNAVVMVLVTIAGELRAHLPALDLQE
jgi:hypothetical protein